MSEPQDNPEPAKDPKSAPSGQTPDPGDLRLHERQEGWAVPLDRVEAFTSGAVISVEPGSIEQELMALWRKAAERARDSGGRLAVARACLWNFIVHSDGEQEYRRSKRTLDEVSETIPARILALHETAATDESQGGVVGDDGAPLRAYVEANYRRVSGGRREVVAEEITLEAPRLQSQRLPGLVRGLLLADVPTALFVANPGAELQWLGQLARDADRFLFDSGRVDSGAALGKIATTLQELFAPEASPGSGAESRAGGGPANGKPRAALTVEIADLGWLRLWPWRNLIASLFDGPQAAEKLRGLDEIQIDYAPGCEPSALLLAGWLVDRLQLAFTDDQIQPQIAPPGSPPVGCACTLSTSESADRSADRPALPPPGRKITLRLLQGSADATPVGIHCVTLRVGDQVFTASGTTTAGTPCITLRSPLAPERVQPVQGRKDSELLIAAMGVGGRDPLMYEALRIGTRLALRRGEVADRPSKG